MDSKLDEKATELNGGIPVFVDVPWVNIRIPGNKDEVIDTHAWLDADNPNSHINRFPVAWAKFKANEAGDANHGFQLKEWPGVLRSQVDHLAHFGIRTVEQLASVSDANLQNIIHGLELRTKARAFLDKANSAEAVRKRIEELEAKLAALTLQPEPKLTTLPAAAAEAPLLAQPEAATEAPKRRGRPPKASATI